MSGNVTLEQVERLAMQLPVEEQLKLVARISEQLTRIGEQLSRSGVSNEPTRLPVGAVSAYTVSPVRWESEAMADKLLRELDSIAESIGGEFDSGSEIRQIREDRSGQL